MNRMSIALTTLTVLTVLIVYIAQLKRNYYDHVTLRNNTVPIKRTNGITNIIFRTFATKNVYRSFYNANEEWKRLNPDHSIVWYTNDDCDRFMKTHYSGTVYDSYRSLKPGAYKADLWRLCILYKFGGVYVDAYTLPFVSITEIINKYKKPFISVLDSEISGGGVHNGFIIAQKGHPYLWQGINDIVHNVTRRYYGLSELDITGPICLAKSIQKVNGKKPIVGYSSNHYLFALVWGPLQNIYDENSKVIMRKNYSFLIYLIRKLGNPNRYTIAWKNRKVYDITP